MRNDWQHFFFSHLIAIPGVIPTGDELAPPPRPKSITLILTRNHKAGFESSLGLPAISDAYQVRFGLMKAVLHQPK